MRIVLGSFNPARGVRVNVASIKELYPGSWRRHAVAVWAHELTHAFLWAVIRSRGEEWPHRIQWCMERLLLGSTTYQSPKLGALASYGAMANFTVAADTGPDAEGGASCKLCHQPMQALATRASYHAHYRCDPCKVTWFWEGTEWVPCESPQLHVAEQESVQQGSG